MKKKKIFGGLFFHFPIKLWLCSPRCRGALVCDDLPRDSCNAIRSQARSSGPARRGSEHSCPKRLSILDFFSQDRLWRGGAT